MFRIESFQVFILQAIETIQQEEIPMINLAAAAVLVRELTEQQFREALPAPADPDPPPQVPRRGFVRRVASLVSASWPLGKSPTSAC
jgi:hypothetical protein